MRTGRAPAHPKESAVLMTLEPGAYTAIVRGAAGTAGIGLVEVVAIDDPSLLLPPVNDTGITYCGDGDRSDLPCPVSGYPGQDAEYGADVTNYDDSDGHAGFSFTKLDEAGNALPSSASHWVCVRDNLTRLVWEVKTDDGGLRDKNSYYSWYNPDSSMNGGDPGVIDSGICVGSRCDTQGYVEAVNEDGLCGARDWRMPTIFELLTIMDNDSWRPVIDTDYFPNTLPGGIFWSSDPYQYYHGHAWLASFGRGYAVHATRRNPRLVRLVHGGQ
jgi:hypothetical protein